MILLPLLPHIVVYGAHVQYFIVFIGRYVESNVVLLLVRTMIRCSWATSAIHGQRKQ